MYARLEKGAGGLTGASEVLEFRRVAGAETRTLSLWSDKADPIAEWWDVEDDVPGHDADTEPEFAVFTIFDGPLSPAVHAAAQRGGRERITPALAEHAGLVRTIVLFQPERHAYLAMVLATSVDAVEAAQQRVMETELLPGEDPALLPGPDRTEIYRVMERSVSR